MSSVNLNFNQEIDTEYLRSYSGTTWDGYELSKHPNFEIDWIDLYPSLNWQYDIISKNKNFKIDWIRKYPDAPWDFEYFLKYIDLTIDFLEEFETKLDFYQISLFQPNFELSWIDRFPQKNWNFNQLSYHTNALTLDFIRKYHDRSWDLNQLTKNFDPLLIQECIRHQTILTYIPHSKRRLNKVFPFLILNLHNIKYCDSSIIYHDKIKTLVKMIFTDNNERNNFFKNILFIEGYTIPYIFTENQIQNMMKIWEAGYSFQNFHPYMLDNLDEPLYITDFSGKSYSIENWFEIGRTVSFPTRDLLAHIREMEPELKGIDIFMDEKSFSKMNDRDIKQFLLDNEDGQEGIIIYPEAIHNYD